jgi:hypothetical protein
MRLAAVIATACTLAALGAVPASAAKVKPVCNLITDDADDATLAAQAGSDPSLDIVGGDFASNGKTITGIIRLKAFTENNPKSPLGQLYYILFNAPKTGQALSMYAMFTPQGASYKYGYDAVDPTTTLNTSYTLGDAKGVRNGNEIRISVDAKNYPQGAALLKNGARVTGIAAEARALFGQRAVPSQNVGPVRVPLGGLTERVDDAAGKPYVLGTKSCVAVGK